MKKLIVVSVALVLACGVFAAPSGGGRGCGGHGGGGRGCGAKCPPPPQHFHHDYHRDDYRGRDSRNFWTGFVGGVVGGAVAASIITEPTVVTPPVVTQPVATQTVIVQQPVVTQPVATQPVTQIQNVWVEGRYVDQVQANGTVVRTWCPGHYEQRTVVVQ